MRAVVAMLFLALAAPGEEAALEALSQQAAEHLQARRIDDTLAVAEQLLEAATRAGNQVYQGTAHLWRGEACLLSEQYQPAIEAYRRVKAVAKALEDESTLAYVALCIGVCARPLRLVEEGLDNLKEAAELYGRQGEKGLAGRAIVLAADLTYASGLLPEAEDLARLGLDLLQDTDRHGERIDALSLLGLIRSTRGDNPAARELYQQALAAARAADDPDRTAKVLNNLGMMAYGDGEYEEALRLLQESIDVLHDTGSRELLILQLGNLATVAHAAGAPEEAIGLYRQALELAEQAGLDDALATACCGLSTILTELGQYAEALDLTARAADIRVKLNDPLGLAAVRANRANALVGQGDLRTALAQLLEAAEVFAQADLKETLATVYNNIGRIYDTQADTATAVDYFLRAMELAAAIERPVLAGIALNNAALALHNAVRPALPLADVTAPEAAEVVELLRQAEEHFNDAAALMERVGERRYLATIHNNLGEVTAALHRFDEAREHLERALALHEELGQRLGQCQTHANLGYQLVQRGQLEAGRRHLQQALALSRELGEVEVRATALFNLALADRADGRLTAAIQQLYASVALTEQRRGQVGGDQTQQRQFLASNIRAYAFLLDLLAEADRPEEAFAVAERAKGRALLDMLQSGYVDLRERIPAAEREQLAALEQRVAAANRRVNELAARRGLEQAALEAARGELESAREALAREEARLAGRYPEVEVDSGRQPLDFPRIAATLPADTALLQYVYGADAIHLFVVTGGPEPRLRTYQVADPEGDLASLVESFRRACANPRRRYQSDGAKLYDRLLRPALDELPKGLRRLVISPDRDLYNCPFQALWDEPAGAFLIDRFELAYTMSGSLLAATLHLGQARRQQPTGHGLLLIADPDFGQGTEPGRLEPRENLPPAVRGFDLAPLPGTRAEAKAIAAVMPRAEALVGQSAREGRVKAALAEYRWLHFATHGLLDPENPLYSAIALAAPTGEDDGEDGFLEARELTRYSLNAELVTLSACQTGRGRSEPGEGLIGLPWAFFVARVPTQVVSLWSVDDYMTLELMTRFYRRLSVGEPKAAALREACRDLREATIEGPGGRPLAARHPFYWAPFVLVGDWR